MEVSCDFQVVESNDQFSTLILADPAAEVDLADHFLTLKHASTWLPGHQTVFVLPHCMLFLDLLCKCSHLPVLVLESFGIHPLLLRLLCLYLLLWWLHSLMLSQPSKIDSDKGIAPVHNSPKLQIPTPNFLLDIFSSVSNRHLQYSRFKAKVLTFPTPICPSFRILPSLLLTPKISESFVIHYFLSLSFNTSATC